MAICAMYFNILVVALVSSGSVFCQRRYSIQLENVEVENNKNEWASWDFIINRYNWTTNVMEGNYTFKQDLPNNTIVHMVGYEKRGVKYHPSLVDTEMQICEFLAEPHIQKIFMFKTNLPNNCRIKKGNYVLSKMAISPEDFPEQISGKHWMMRFTVYHRDVTVGDIKIYATVDRVM